MIKQILCDLGITRNYAGYYQTLAAIELVLEDETRLCSMTHRIYEVIAKQHQCTAYSVERNIRTVIFRAWRINKSLLNDIMAFPLTAPPSVSEFLSCISDFARKKELRLAAEHKTR